MTVSLRSHVLRRDEKGMLGIPFKRLLVAGMGGGISLAVLQNVIGSVGGLFVALAVAICALIVTASRGGIPNWQRAVYGLQARFLLAAARPTDLLHPVAQAFNMPSNSMILDSLQLFGSKEAKALTSPDQWVMYTDLNDELGLTLVESPAGAIQR